MSRPPYLKTLHAHDTLLMMSNLFFVCVAMHETNFDLGHILIANTKNNTHPPPPDMHCATRNHHQRLRAPCKTCLFSLLFRRVLGTTIASSGWVFRTIIVTHGAHHFARTAQTDRADSLRRLSYRCEFVVSIRSVHFLSVGRWTKFIL